MEQQQRQAAAGDESKWTVAGEGQQKGMLAGDKSIDTCNDESGWQTT